MRLIPTNFDGNKYKELYGDYPMSRVAGYIEVADDVDLSTCVTSYQELRRAEYPPLSDLADAMYWSEKGDTTLLNAYISKCDAVKEKYPK